MKVSVVITKAEKDQTQQLIFREPCTYIECGEIDCDVCPLHGRQRHFVRHKRISTKYCVHSTRNERGNPQPNLDVRRLKIFFQNFFKNY